MNLWKDKTHLFILYRTMGHTIDSGKINSPLSLTMDSGACRRLLGIYIILDDICGKINSAVGEPWITWSMP
jgi:hypothetical protein